MNGTVVDASGEPLPGVAVIVLQTKAGITTDMDGHFTLEVPDDKHTVLTFSMLGMKRQEVMLGEQKNLQITMEEESLQLGDEWLPVIRPYPKKEVLVRSVWYPEEK